ncbi:MAG: sigma-70 family RNA polymerase sigma factor [Bacteroidales bacterium]|nr:sigma-70 family RNA polymerase sigma factor [Bacteroidales bacterium]
MEIGGNLTQKAQKDYALVLEAIKGNQDAYAELMKNYKDSLYFMLLKMTNNATDAEDLTIEAFGKAFKRIDSYSPKYAFSTWLFKIATNNAIDFIRKKKKHALSIDKPYSAGGEGPDISQNIKFVGLDPEETIIKDQKIQLMRGVVSKLKPHYRTLIELRYFKEYTYEEIVVELDLPLGTVKAQLFRAREFLFNVLRNSKDKI